MDQVQINQRPPVQPLQLRPTIAPASTTAVHRPDPALLKDAVHFSPNQRKGDIPAIAFAFKPAEAIDPEKEFASAVEVNGENYVAPKRFVGLFNISPSQEKKIQAAEARAFSRFEGGNDAYQRGSMQAKLRQSALDAYYPGYNAHSYSLGSTPEEQKIIMNSLTDYGRELGVVALTGKTEKEFQRHMEDKFFITVFDRDKEEFEEYFKNGYHKFIGDKFSQNDPDNPVPITASTESAPGKPDPNAEQFRVRYFRPRVGVKLSGLDYKEAKIKPSVDLIKVQSNHATELRVTANGATNIKGDYDAEFEISGQRMFNKKIGEYGSLKENIFIESRAKYELKDNQLQSTLGVRKQISPDSSFGFYGLYSKTFLGHRPEDFGVGANYQSRFD